MTAPPELEAPLRRGLAALSLELEDGQVLQLLDYLALLDRWNQVYNLTAVRDPGQMLTQHLLDCLAVVGPLRRRTGGQAAAVLDIGSGGGLPGAVLALCCPELRVTCLDAVAKKSAFLTQVAASLALPNLAARHGRVESVTERHDVLCCRAFSSLPDLVALSSQALAPGGSWLAMKGKRPDAELAALPANIVFHVEPLRVPGLDADRCIVWMAPAQAGRTLP